ncbi:hypothetical protein AB205_0201420 [Aquarana catesbeiana]|uniref:Uncharacterized protein n=1 Tax=Aquarana catesbeiana TaxID=8400 RepID=A0A2G9QC81_AQUCT|nr:hypothetical protein AB205_0201420 [Aquarana catesbeiana]
MQTRFCVRRGHSAAVYTSGRRSTRDKRLGRHHSSEDTRDSTPQEEGEIPQTQPEEEEGDIEIGEIGTTTGDGDVVEEDHFTSESA